MTNHPEPGKDRRTRRTRNVLQTALAALIREKSYDHIAVKEILHRADVGRSTFYAHYEDKDELLVSSIGDILRHADRGLLGFSRAILEHHAAHRDGARAVTPAEQAHLHERLERVLEQHIGEQLHDSQTKVPAPLLAEHIAGTFVRVLNWWMETDCRVSAREADEIFRSLVAPSLELLAVRAD